MKVVIQRVSCASVKVNDNVIGKIAEGLMILVGIENTDTQEDSDWLVHKIINLRIFNDENNIMNKSLLDIDGEVMIVSQFTLHAKTKKGHRPSYIHAAKPEKAIPLYEVFIRTFEEKIQKKIAVGKFGAMMDVKLINHGPVTIIIDTKNKQ